MKTRKFAYKETVLNIKSDKDVFDGLAKEVFFQRKQLERYMEQNPEFGISLEPFETTGNAPEIARIMADSAKIFGIGPMAAVAGTLAELVAKKGIELGARKILIENGGDICMYAEGDDEFVVKIYAGDSTPNIGFKVKPNGFSGVCTSSASVGHSISFGESDATVVAAKSAAVADAAATAIGNVVKGGVEESVRRGVEFAKKFTDKIDGALIIRGGSIGRLGKLPEMIEID